ncbi:MAG: hypothetical protein M3081_00340 [Gemmatimonadota bacterium]|nr:hypothetical protein [Gemmatimonadota bacterium]
MKRLSSMVLAGAASALALASSLSAQVGYQPQASPYRDLFYRHELSLLGGYYGGDVGTAKVAPGSGPITGVRYDIRIGGPVAFTMKAQRSFTDRRVLDPNQPFSQRFQGSTSAPVYLIDAGLTMHLTGQRTWHNLTPLISGGAGIASDFGGGVHDPGDFTVGTPLAFNFGGGIRYNNGGRYAVRVDFGTYLYEITYPASYHTPPGGGGPIVGGSAGAAEWKYHKVLTIGFSKFYGR